jgi:hypothetical protein
MPNPEQDAAPPVRAWSCSRGWLVWRGPATQPTVRWLPARRASGAPLAEPPAHYWLVGHDGEVAAKFESEGWTVEDELGGILYAVEDGTLVKLTISDRMPAPLSIREEVVMSGLAPLAAGEVKASRLIAGAIEHELAWQEARRRSEELAGGARVAAIPGSLERFDAGDAFQRAQAQLSRQVARYYAPTSEAMLRALTAFGAAHRAASGAWRDTLAWAMEPFVAACRVVGNDLPAKDVKLGEHAGDPSPPPPEQRGAARELAESLPGVRAKVLDYKRQMEESDANLTAIELGEAAKLVETAHARMLGLIG